MTLPSSDMQIILEKKDILNYFLKTGDFYFKKKRIRFCD